MTASSDPGSYGELTTYIVDDSENALPDGPIRVAGNAESQPEISQRISLDNQGEGGSEVRFGDMQLIPIADGLIFIRPYYVSVPQNSGDVDEVTEDRFAIAPYNDRSVLEPTIGEARARLVPGFEGAVGDQVTDPAAPTADDLSDDTTETEDSDPSSATTEPPIVVSGDAEELLVQADELFAEADAALAAGDLGEYQLKIDQGRQLIAEAVALLAVGDAG